MKYKNAVVTNVMWAYADLRHEVVRNVTAIWYHVAALFALSMIVERTQGAMLTYIRACVLVLILRWLMVLRAYIRVNATKNAVYRTTSVSHAFRLGKTYLLRINGAWFTFRKVGEAKGAKWEFDLSERTYKQGTGEL